MHTGWPRCSFLKYSRYSRSSRLARGPQRGSHAGGPSRAPRSGILASYFALGTLAVALALLGGPALAQVPPNPYRIVEGWAKLPNGRKMGAVGKVGIAPDGTHIWAI